VIAGAGPIVRRVLLAAAAVVLAVLVSLSWITAVSLVPSHERPYVDGSKHDSLFEQVFVYNGFSRFGNDQSTASGEPVSSSFASLLAFRLPAKPSPTRLLSGAGGRDIGWLVPAALVAGLAVLWRRRNRPRDDLLRAGALFWGAWLVIHLVAFSLSTGINAYYLAALGPAVAALCGIGVAELRSAEQLDRSTLYGLATVVAVTIAYGIWLTPRSTSAPRLLAIVAAVAVLVEASLLMKDGEWRRARFGLGLVVVAAIVLPFTATLDIVTSGLGPFDTPYQSAAATHATQAVPRQALTGVAPGMSLLLSANKGRRYVAGIDSSLVAAPLIVDSGKEFEPIGGFLGTSPSPTLATIQHQVATGQVQTFIVIASVDPRIVWIRTHCLPVPQVKGAAPPVALPGLGIFFCTPGSVRPSR
jgi:4-amino-4-deoxy-L-arabinose transferase-like glycosyltransferase